MKYLKKYLGYYKKLEKLNQTKDKTFNKTLSFSVSPLKMKPNDLYGWNDENIIIICIDKFMHEN